MHVLHRTQKKEKATRGTDVNELKKINSTQQGVYVKEVKNYIKKFKEIKISLRDFHKNPPKNKSFPKQ